MSRLFSAFLRLFLLAQPIILFAQTPTITIGTKPAWVSDIPIYNGAFSGRDVVDGYFLRHFETQINVDEQQQYTHVTREIISEAGVQNGSEISVIFDPVYEKISFSKITVWRKNVPINRLDTKKFKIIAEEKDLSRFIYQGTYNAYLILDDIRKGDRIEYSYTRTGRNPIFEGKFSTFIRLQESYPVLHRYISVTVSNTRKLKFRYFNRALKGKLTQLGNRKVYTWQMHNLKPLKYDEDTPSWFGIAPYTQITEYKDWTDVAKWAESVNPAESSIKGPAASYLNHLMLRYKNDKAGLFRAAVRFVQDEVRYMGVELGQYSHRANNPNKVFLQRYGDCKDKSLLLVSLLRSAGFFDARIALVSTTDKATVADYLPSPDLFDHVIVCVTVAGKKVWVDPTISYQGGDGTDICTPSYGKALLVSGDTRALTDMTPSKRGKYKVSERFTVTSVKNNVELEVETVYTLAEADNIRSSFAEKSIESLEKEYLNYYSQIYPKIKASDTVSFKDDKVRNEFIIIEKYIIPDFFSRDSLTGTYNVTYRSNYIDNAFPKLKPERTQPLYINSSNIEHIIQVDIPEGWNIDDINKEVKNDIFNFRYNASSQDNTLTLHYELENLTDYVPAKVYQSYAKDVQEIRDNYLSYATVYLAPNSGFYPNYWLIGIASVFLLALFVGAYLHYNRETFLDFDSAPLPIGGWLIVVMLFLAGAVFGRIHEIIENNYLDLNTWNFYSARSNDIFYKVTIVTKLVSAIYVSVMALYCLWLMMKRRDILPATIIVYYVSASLLLLFTYILTNVFHGQEQMPFSTVMWFAIFSAINIQYFRNSSRVKETFVVPAFEYLEDDKDEEAIEEVVENI